MVRLSDKIFLPASPLHPPNKMYSRFLQWAFASTFLHFRYIYAVFSPSEVCFYSCDACLYPLDFEGSADACSNLLRVKSWFFCASIYCSKDELEAGLKYGNDSCIEEGIQWPSFESVVPSLETLDSVRRVSPKILLSKTPIEQPIIPDEEFFTQGHRTVSAFYVNIFWSNYFSWSLYGFWCLVLLIGIVNRAVEVFTNRRRSDYNIEKENRRYASLLSTQSRLWLWIRTSLILPATFGHHCQEPIGWSTIPPRLESLLIALYIILNFVYCFPGYRLFKPNLYFSEPKSQLSRYISDRTGTLAIANVPILWVFATRNDPFLWLTGWSFATYNRFHRWVARVATLQAIVHGVGYSVFSFYDGGAAEFDEDWSERYWWTGEIALIVMCFMLAASVYAIRNSHYDLFLVMHVVFAIIFIVTLYYHIKIFSGEYNAFIWPCVAIWSLDRLLRLARIIHSSLLPRLLKSTKAVVTYDKHTEMLRVDISDFPISQEIRPGVFYYVYVPAALKGYESHPFALCSWRRKALDSPAGSSVTSMVDEKRDQKYGEQMVQPNSTSEASEGVCHTFLIRPYAGFTRRLRNKVASSLESHSSHQMTVLLEGPYGKKQDLRRFSDVLILCGGSGITAAISHAHFLLESGSTAVHITWTLPQRRLVDDICAHELAAVISSERLDMAVYLTGTAVVESSDALATQAPYEVHFGRPDFYAVMAESRRQCCRDLAVVSCGTPQMADACRKAVVKLLQEDDGPRVEYFNETMEW